MGVFLCRKLFQEHHLHELHESHQVQFHIQPLQDYFESKIITFKEPYLEKLDSQYMSTIQESPSDWSNSEDYES